MFKTPEILEKLNTTEVLIYADPDPESNPMSILQYSSGCRNTASAPRDTDPETVPMFTYIPGLAKTRVKKRRKKKKTFFFVIIIFFCSFFLFFLKFNFATNNFNNTIWTYIHSVIKKNKVNLSIEAVYLEKIYFVRLTSNQSIIIDHFLRRWSFGQL